MYSKELLKQKRMLKEYTISQVAELVGCSEDSLKKYFEGKTVYGKYLTTIMEILDISLEEWNGCINVKEKLEHAGV